MVEYGKELSLLREGEMAIGVENVEWSGAV